MRPRLIVILLLGLMCWQFSRSTLARPENGGATQQGVDDEQERRTMDLMLKALEKNPRRGTTLDRVYGIHVERGRLQDLLKQYQQRTQHEPHDGAAWMVLGLLEAQRNRDALAVAAFQNAEKERPEDFLASYYLGQALVLVGQPAVAAEAFERAIARKPPTREVFDVYQALGRVYQRLQRPNEARNVWKRLEERFPNDLRVQEQIAATLAEEGEFQPALERYQKLAKNPAAGRKDITFRMEAAELLVRLGREREALNMYEALLADLPAEGWQQAEARRKLEDVFLRHEDLSGLIKYYQEWVAKNPSDLAALARLANAFHLHGQDAEARAQLVRALTLAPSRVDLRQQLIEYLVHEQKFAEALAQHEQFDKFEPANPDHLREWGWLLLGDESKPEPERQRAAAAIWRRLLPKPNGKPDPLASSQVADLFRQAGMVEDALALYRQAVAAAPQVAQYRVHLGEFLLSLHPDQPKDALAIWHELVEGTNRTPANLKYLAEVLAGFGFRQEALVAITAACELDKDEPELWIQRAELLFRLERYGEALQHLETAGRLASSPEDVERILEHQLKNYQAGKTLGAAAEKLAKEMTAAPTADGWYRLARYRAALRHWPQAITALQSLLKMQKELAAEKKLVTVLAAAARIFEDAGDLRAATDTFRQLAGIDPGNRADHWMQVTRLETKLGRREEALQAGKEMLAASPDRIENYQYYASLCVQLGQGQEALEVLRRAVRLNANDPEVLAALASALADRFQTEEAIELFWRTFDKNPRLEEKLTAVNQLAGLYLRTNQFDRLLEKLNRLRREQGQASAQRMMTLCVAQAYQASGDLGAARRELEEQLTIAPNDQQLLKQLVSLSEREGDADAAVRWQERLVKLSPKDNEQRLAALMFKAGQTEEAAAIWQRQGGTEKTLTNQLELIDNLLLFGKNDQARTLTKRFLRDHPDHWELLYRDGLASAGLDRRAEAKSSLQALLALQLTDDEISELLQAKKNGPGSQHAVKGPQFKEFPLRDRINIVVSLARQAAGLQARNPGDPPYWPPGDFGQARMAGLGMLLVHWHRRTASRRTSCKRYRA